MRKLALFVGVLLLVGAGLAAAPIMTPSASAAKGDVPCSAYDRPVYAAINPTTQASVLSYWATDVAIAADDGYTNYIGTIGKGAAVYQYGLWTMYRLTNAKTHDTVWVNRGTELDGLVKKGYVKGPHDFYASLKPSGCVVPVYRLVKSGIHRYTKVKSTRDRLVAAGWKYEKIAFYLGPPTATENQFTFAVVPDTQQEVLKPTDTRLDNRVNWMLQQRTTTDLQFVVATGDLANWDTPHHEQFAKVSKSFVPIATKMPFASAPGNHDTAAVCPGGSACPGAKAWVTVRNTKTYNTYFGQKNVPRPALKGQFESGKIDNSYQIVTAGKVSWLLLSLELWPRPEVVSWAAKVVAANPKSNVVVVTHSYLTSKGAISTSNGGYGSTSPKYLWDHLVKVYPNVKFVVSGHVGKEATRTDKGVHGNTVVSFLTTVHSTTTNPTRYVEVDTKTGSVVSRVYAPYGKGMAPAAALSTSTSGLSFVKP